MGEQGEFGFEEPKRPTVPDLSKTEPLVWIKELRLYKELRPDGLIRAIKLRPGMNILWAKPLPPEEAQLRQDGVSGHSAGKTLFCRMLRYILGESNFAAEPTKSTIRSTFLNGYVVAEVRLGGEVWTVVRPFGLSSDHHSYRDMSIEQLFAPTAEKSLYKAFKDRLNELAMRDIPMKTFPASGAPVTWEHVLPWLSRDQECHMGHPAIWRDTKSQSGAPTPEVEENTQIVRAIIRHLQSDEEELLTRRDELEAKKKSLQRKNELDGYLVESHKKSFERRNEIELSLYNFSQELEQGMAVQRLADSNKALEGEKKSLAISAPLLAAEQALRAVGFKIATLQSEIKQAESNLGDDETALKTIIEPEKKKEAPPSWREQNRNAPPRRCNVPLDVAESHGCHLAYEHRSQSSAPLNELKRDLATERERYLKAIEQDNAYLETLRTRMAGLENEEREALANYDKIKGEIGVKQDALSDKINSNKFLANQIAETKSAWERLEKNRSALKKAELDYNTLLKDCQKARERSNDILGKLNAIFADVLKDILGKGTDGEIKFDINNISLDSDYHKKDLSSEAIKAACVIAFDYATLVMGIEGACEHPRLLIHDSPRVADLSAGIYSLLFKFMRQLEESYKDAPLSFQYIVTTTEPPPDELLREPWLISPVLDSMKPSFRLLGVDL